MGETCTSVRFDHVVGSISNNDQIDVGILEHSRVNVICQREHGRARGTGGTEVIVTDVDIRCRRTAGAIHDLVEAADCLCGGGNPNAVGK